MIRSRDHSGSSPRSDRFDEFVQQKGITVLTVNQFSDYAVDVALPPGWEPFQSPPGTRACIWPADPFRARFCANVVLTMTTVEAVLDPAEVFLMLCEWQRHLVPGTEEISRDLSAACEGPGVAGVLDLRIPSANGQLDSCSVARILFTERCTLIAQLTLTALRESPVDRADIGLAVTIAAATGRPASTSWTANAEM